MTSSRFCDGMTRRNFVKVGALGTGLTLSDYLRLTEAGAVAPKAKGKSAIFIQLGGGPTHMDTFDLKPDAPAEYRGDLKPIKTNVHGIEISEQLPRLAQCADKFTILRGVHHTLAAHDLGARYMTTGNRPLPSLEYPAIGAVASKELPAPADLPSYIVIPDSRTSGPGALGVQYGPFSTNERPQPGKTFNVRGMGLPEGMTVTDLANREQLLATVDARFRNIEAQSDVLTGLDKFSQRAYQMISTKRTRDAFDLAQEDPRVTERFGKGQFGQSALLAARLVEAGARFVTLADSNWDMHQTIYKRLGERMPDVDQSLSALLTTLDERGLLESTMVFMYGEFGRTPKINARAGRDHWPRAMFVFMAGGGLKTGQVIGASDAKGEGPANDAITPDDVAASIFHGLGIDPHKEYQTNTGRPMMITRNGKVIPRLFG